MNRLMLFTVCILWGLVAQSQTLFSIDSIKSSFVLSQRRNSFEKHMRETTLAKNLSNPLTAENEDAFKEACWTISQFILRSDEIKKGLDKVFARYDWLESGTKRALLEAVYASYPFEYLAEMKALLKREKNIKYQAMEALYLFRAIPNESFRQQLLQLTNKTTDNLRDSTLLAALKDYLLYHEIDQFQPSPDLNELFLYQQVTGQKMVYSFQRWNRDYPGLAIIQNANGLFIRDSLGQLVVFEQLARAASDLPFFITNGNTPQGIYRILGMDVSRNQLIGPTPNIQLIMPNETDSGFWHTSFDSTKTGIEQYLALLPQSWRDYRPMTESYLAGKIGRSEIIAHGSAIDPKFFNDKPFFPLTPTMGCLCARENWNPTNGSLIESEQLRMVNRFLSTPGNTGYLMVINLDNQQKKVTREELEILVENFEKLPLKKGG